MRSIYFLTFPTLLLLFSSCIKDDIIDDEVPETLRIITSPDTLGVGDTFQMVAQYTNRIGQAENRMVSWFSLDESIATVESNGLVIGRESGTVQIIATAARDDGTELRNEIKLVVAANTVTGGPQVKTGNIASTSFYTLSGEFTITQNGSDLIINFAQNYEADQALPGLYVYLTNNPTTTNGAREIGPVTVFEGSHSYEVENAGINDFIYLLYFCKPFRVKVGDGEIVD